MSSIKKPSMKKVFLFTGVVFMTLFYFANNRYGLLSMAGLNSKGLPTKKVNGLFLNNVLKKSNAVDHSEWNKLLQKHVSQNGNVNYKAFKTEKEKLDAYLDKLAQQVPTDNWTVQEQLAYYINLYNAYTVLLILDNYPVNSIKDINGAWTKDIVTIGDKELSLGALEHSILRKMNEPRIHFAINCASASCPKLLNEAFLPQKLDQQLEAVTLEFINSDKNTITTEKVELSRIFKWYKGDFNNGDLTGYINRYSTKKIDEKAKIGYQKYDWSINEQK
jgi:hypothetical protein